MKRSAPGENKKPIKGPSSGGRIYFGKKSYFLVNPYLFNPDKK
jgi:hypothetical protein